MSQLDLGNVVRVSILSAPAGLATPNTSIVAIITDDVPIPADYGVSGSYLNPSGVANDFGSNSDTYRIAQDVFNQSPNILSGRGQLVVVPRLAAAAAQPAVLSGSGTVDLTALTATDYNINVSVDGAAASDLLIGEIDSSTVEAAETSLNSVAVSGAGIEFVVSGQDPAAVTIELKTSGTGATASIELADASTGTDIAGLLNLAKTLEVTGADAGTERVKDAILRTKDAVPYFGIVLNEKQSDADLTEIAALVQGLDKMLFVGSNLSADLTAIFKTLKDSGYTHTRCLYYSVSEEKAIDFAASYAGRGLSVNFDATGTAITMHLKDIVGLVADAGLTQTLLDSAGRNGVDVYGNLGGVAKVFTSGANQYFDQVYNRLALKLRLQVAGFNFLAQTVTKIPQTEEGLNGLKAAYRNVLETFVAAGVFAPGAWNSSTTFGTPEDTIRNVAERGYYIYSIPISQQSQSVREQRIAPLMQIAAKESGAIHSGDITVLVEA